MKTKTRVFFLFCSAAFILSSARAFALSAGELIANAKKHDGEIVILKGEVIGDIMFRGKNAWLNISYGENALGVWADKGLTKGIAHSGGYKYQGDIVEIEGEFHRACPEHGADIDVHARSIKVIQKGKKTVRPLDENKRNLAVIMAGLLCLGLILKRLK